MSITVRLEPALDLEAYSQVRMELTVRSQFRVEMVDGGLGGWTLTEEPVHPPFHKDYDEHWPPTEWVKHDLSNWALFAAFDGQLRVGGAAVAWNSAGLNMLQGRTDIAVLWDIRVRRGRRRSGVGSRLFDMGAEWARRRGCRRLIIETQNVNVPACRFYAGKGAQLRAVHHDMYPECPGEVQFLWYLDL